MSFSRAALVALSLSTLAAFAADTGVVQRVRETTLLPLYDGGTLPAAVQGALVWDIISGQYALSDGGVWAEPSVGTTNTPRATSYVYATMNVSQSTNIAAGDHFKLNTALADGGTLITLDPATAYTKSDNVASLGRFTLSGDGGNTYLLEVNPSIVNFSGGGLLTYAWYNADTGVPIGNGATVYAATQAGHIAAGGHCFAVFTPGIDTRVEVRIITATSLSSFGGTSPSADGGTIKRNPDAVVRTL